MDTKWAVDADPDQTSVARAYDYLLGGNHNFAVDREAAQWAMSVTPDAADQARANRAFLQRVVKYLVGIGVRQFLDIGSGIPTVGNVHEIAQRADPNARVVYVDKEPIAVAHSREILSGNDRATAIQEDLRRPAAILAHPEVRETLDFDQPIGLLLVAILHAIPDEDEPHSLVATLRDTLAGGSYLAVSHMTSFAQGDAVLQKAEQLGLKFVLRTRNDIEAFFDGFDLVPPGLVRLPHWRPDDPATIDTDADWCNSYGGVGQLTPGRGRPARQGVRRTTPSTTPTAAGMYDYFLDGNAHSPVDRVAAERSLQIMPSSRDAAWANRGFLQRAVRTMAAEWGIRQFIDIGCGLPTQRNTHDVVAEAIPDGRVVYVDNDPVVVERAREVLGHTDRTTVIEGDVRQPERILDHPETQRLIDPTQPVGLLLVAVLHYVSDDDDPWSAVARYRDRLASGSYIAISHISIYHQVSDEVRQAGQQAGASMSTPPTDRARTEIERFLHGMQIMPPYPGAAPELVHVGLWGAEDPEQADSDGSRLAYAAVARVS